jgi:hypothetical protein
MGIRREDMDRRRQAGAAHSQSRFSIPVAARDPRAPTLRHPRLAVLRHERQIVANAPITMLSMRTSIDRTLMLSVLGSLAAVGASGARGSAQQPAIGVVAQSGRLTTARGDAELSSWVGVAGRIDRSRWLFDGRASVGTAGSGAEGSDLEGRIRASTPVFGRLAIFAEVRGRDATLEDTRARSLGAEARLAWTGGDGGLYLAADAGRDLPSVPWGRGSSGMGLGGWRSFGDLVLSVGVADRRASSNRVRINPPGTRPDSIWNDTVKAYVPATVFVPGSVDTVAYVGRWGEMNVAAHWWRPWLAISARAGIPLVPARASRTPWGDLEATVPLGGRFAAVAVGGWQPVATRANDRPARFLALGLRLLPRPLHHRPLPLGVSVPAGFLSIAEGVSGDRVVRVRAPLARMVELSADFTGWQPVALEAAAGGEWSTRLRISSGTYRVAVRIDGGRWIAPPGTPRVADDFGSESGMIVVK